MLLEIILPAGADPDRITVRDIPALFADAIHPNAPGNLKREILWVNTCNEYMEKVKEAALHGQLQPRSPVTLLPLPDAMGDGLLRSFVTVENLTEFAKSLGVDVTVAESSIQSGDAGVKGESGAGETSSDSWKEQARAIADECFNHDTELNCRDSLKSYSRRVMDIMQERGIKGARGIIDNPNTIMREALQGDEWWAKKSK